MEYILTRNKRRKKLMLTVKVTGEVEVRAGYFTSRKTIDDFVNKNREWIEKQQKIFEDKYHHRIIVPKGEKAAIKSQLLPQMTQLVQYYSQIMGVNPKGVTITSAQKRWGSCSSKGSVCFSYRAFFLSERCKHYLVVHEMCHLVHMNHSADFYTMVEKHMPNYKEAEKELAGYYITEE